jgi:ribosomal protein L4
MEVAVYNIQGEKVRTIELAPHIFEVEPNVGLMHQAYVRQMANARLGTHSTKGRQKYPEVEENHGARKVREEPVKVQSVQLNG